MRFKILITLALASLALASPASAPQSGLRGLAGDFDRSAWMNGTLERMFREAGDAEASLYFRGKADAFAQAAVSLRAELDAP